MAIERVVGKMGFESTKVFDLEKESLRRRLLDDPYGILKDRRLAEYVADQLAFDGLSFSRSLVNHLSNRKKGSDVRHWRERWKVKVIFAQMWTHPELPLWVMESPALSATFTKCLPTGLSQYVSKESLRENWKPRRSRFAVIPRSQLKRSSKLLISKILFDFAEEDGNQKIVIEKMDIHGKLKCSSAWEEYNRNFNNKHVQ